ncbi:formimidoylglutamase [Marinobacter xestospongiae]|uniref:Formimidoylglutamase n=1 Tax=Marinobacter xestospongiae TaxID=994319 RepID=A0ABU3VZ48_9GAMM|nr:formimidoylglutamase [Marinobacter xestospongiae]MDV2079526.1 formimidoylglutamase [Marinobacter xestospongiae]
MAIDLQPQPWQGRLDPEDGPSSVRWHQRIDPASQTPGHAEFGLLGFACDAGVRRNKGRPGAAAGPTAFRGQLRNLAWHGDRSRMLDFGDVVVEGDALEAGQARLAEAVAESLDRVYRLLVIGGGHETAWGCFSGLHQTLPANTRVGIINLDAHFDLRKPGADGVSSGTPFYQIAEKLGADAFHYCCLGVSRTSNTQALFDRADELGVLYREDREMLPRHVPEICQQIRDFCAAVDVLYLTIDLDVLPHFQSPGVSAPAVRGVSLEVVQSVIEEVLRSSVQCRYGLPLVDMTELNPDYDVHGITAKTAAMLADTLLCR